MHGPQKSRYFIKAVVEKLHLNSTIGLLDITKEIQMNKKFKVGDTVRRINTDNARGAKVGQIAEVRAVSAYTITVFYIGCKIPTGHAGALWMSCNAELVPALKSVCKFVPGNTYKDRTGKEYRFVIYAKEAAPQWRAVFLTSSGNVTCRCVDGSVNISGWRWSEDILPNKRTRTINVYRNNTTGSLAAVASDDVGAGAVHFTKIGEVVEEYEEF